MTSKDVIASLHLSINRTALGGKRNAYQLVPLEFVSDNSHVCFHFHTPLCVLFLFMKQEQLLETTHILEHVVTRIVVLAYELAKLAVADELAQRTGTTCAAELL